MSGLLLRDSSAAFRTGCRPATADLAALNDAWGTAFWSQRYGDWAEITRRALAPTP